MKIAVSIKDVADTLGVSVSTVSRVINDQDRVSSEMRKKVTEAVQELNYVPGYAAVSIIKKQTRLVAVLVPDLRSPFYASMVQGIEETFRKIDYYTLVVATGSSKNAETDFLNSMIGQSVDGAVIVPSTSNLSHLSDYTKPFVLLDRNTGDYDFDCVTADNFRGAYLAAEHLITMGHKKIAIISGDKTVDTGHERHWGFEQAMRDNGVRIRPEYDCVGGRTEKDGYENAFKLFHMDDTPTAIFAAGRELCRGVIMALHDLRLKVGKDISLVGFGDSDMARLSSPPVSVVSSPDDEMGRIGAQILLDKITTGAEQVSCQRISLPVKLSVRGSVREIG